MVNSINGTLNNYAHTHTNKETFTTAESAVAVAQNLENILSDAPAEDQTAENVDLVTGVLSNMLALGDTITAEVRTCFVVTMYFIL